jgi:hypothetical protein
MANIDDRYYLDPELSINKTTVYIDKTTNDIAMVNRGTSDIKDVMTDTKLLFGYKDKSRFGEARDFLNKVKQNTQIKILTLLGTVLVRQLPKIWELMKGLKMLLPLINQLRQKINNKTKK